MLVAHFGDFKPNKIGVGPCDARRKLKLFSSQAPMMCDTNDRPVWRSMPGFVDPLQHPKEREM